jgi:hypothetical protein
MGAARANEYGAEKELCPGCGRAALMTAPRAGLESPVRDSVFLSAS